MIQLFPLSAHYLLLQSNPDRFNLYGASLPRLSWKRPLGGSLITGVPNQRDSTNGEFHALTGKLDHRFADSICWYTNLLAHSAEVITVIV